MPWTPEVGDRKRLSDRGDNIVRISQRHEIDEGDPVREQACPRAGRFHSQSCLADPGRAGEGKKSHPGAANGFQHLLELGSTSDELRRWRGEIDEGGARLE